jgi:hypothetical protein
MGAGAFEQEVIRPGTNAVAAAAIAVVLANFRRVIRLLIAIFKSFIG